MDLARATLTGTGNNLQVSYGDDKGLLVEFFDDAVEQPFESANAGRAIFKPIPHISIIYPGDKTKKTYRPATDQDKRRFPMQWAAFEKNEQAVESGTPITQWLYLSKSQALELKHMGFWTVELLANASDMQISSFMGGMGLRAQAKAFLASAEGNSALTSLVAENERLGHTIKQLQDQISGFQEKFDALEKSAKSKKD